MGAIPPNKVAGEWARNMGLVLARYFKLDPRGAIGAKDQKYKLTREDLLTTYIPKTTVHELLNGKNAIRAIEYYAQALGHLAKQGLIARAGDAVAAGDVEKTVKEIFTPHPSRKLPPLPTRNYGKDFLDADPHLQPGEHWREPLAELSAHTFDPKPKNLSKPRKARKRQSKATS